MVPISQLFSLSFWQPQPITAAHTLRLPSQPIDIPGPHTARHVPRAGKSTWVPKPAAPSSQACLRTVVAGKLSQRAQRALRAANFSSDTIERLRAARRIDAHVTQALTPSDRVFLHLDVGGDALASARLAALDALQQTSPTEALEKEILTRVLAPFQALRALLALEPDTCEPQEKLAQEFLLSFCDDPAGVQTKRPLPFILCNFDVRNGGLFKARQRVAVADAALLLGSRASEPVNITGALGAALDQLRLAGFPDL